MPPLVLRYFHRSLFFLLLVVLLSFTSSLIQLHFSPFKLVSRFSIFLMSNSPSYIFVFEKVLFISWKKNIFRKNDKIYVDFVSDIIDDF